MHQYRGPVHRYIYPNTFTKVYHACPHTLPCVYLILLHSVLNPATVAGVLDTWLQEK